ncbi:UDP-N-acetylglucosamine 2-epimerase [Kaistella jeonii]|uniref:UDP-N-acetylglucosamine 2-epimerase n=1 Tax=Kaistella jeonii TaxID=266749 RepID=A0A0C1FMF9_9FLAO|nr:UDP-N-acetylglucosamine 2-epimerase [Kaistella jeonii]KIA89124.1 UDP-N-acetylglucosamine 2-epimerase [Kaistella jeonii]SFB93821.1 GDP/UDP-N,N'-diacetylbacillosamine 2-epimerase (hydrolysing) [Kaistella jeonii]VEI97061.1 Polysialic acid biosynthesis protein P7 [Kaistella jeonii]
MKITIATGTRAEYGLLKPLLTAIKKEPNWLLQILVTGAHLSPEFGLTYNEIEKDGFVIDKKVEMLLSADTPASVVKSMGLGMIGFADALQDLKPDLLIILGDRYEMLSLASAALIFNIPIVHLHGGEITEGAYDDAIRHSITKMSHLHFASTDDYQNRIIQLGENPQNVYNVGAIGLDSVKNLELLSRESLEKDLDIQFKKYNYQITFHPSTLDIETPEKQFEILLKAIDQQQDSFFIFTKSNADSGGRIINQMIDSYVAKNKDKAKAFSSLGNLRFLSVVKMCDAIVGNSSSGILEAPSLQTPTINIGDRQKGRIQAKSVINVKVDGSEILEAFKKVRLKDLNSETIRFFNPYGDGNTTEKIIKILRSVDLKNFRTKQFHDLKN